MTDERSDTSSVPTEKPMQDLTPELVRDWLQSACIDAVLDDDGWIFAVLERTRVSIHVDANIGIVFVSCLIGCSTDTGASRSDWLEAVNFVNNKTMYVRAVLRESTEYEHAVRYEHELFAVGGTVSREQIVRLVRMVRSCARERHSMVHEMACG